MLDILLINLAATWYMTGLIWFVQIVHYPLFADVVTDVEGGQFTAYHKRHMDTTGWAVGPAMLVEFITGFALLYMRSPLLPAWIVWSGASGIVVIWLSTALVQVPTHYKLSRGWASPLGNKLVWTNWVRTVFWTARALLMAYAMRLCMHPS